MSGDSICPDVTSLDGHLSTRFSCGTLGPTTAPSTAHVCCVVGVSPVRAAGPPFSLLRGTIVYRTYGILKKPTRYLFNHFFLVIFGPISYGPP